MSTSPPQDGASDRSPWADPGSDDGAGARVRPTDRAEWSLGDLVAAVDDEGDTVSSSGADVTDRTDAVTGPTERLAEVGDTVARPPDGAPPRRRVITEELPVSVVQDVDDGPVDADRPPRRWARRVVGGVLIVLLALAVYYLVSLYQVWSVGRADEREPVDAIVVMGAAQYDGRPSPQLAERLDHVVTLWPEGLAPLVVVTGGNIPGDRFTEAEASANYLVERGVPADAILMESQGSSSFESLAAVAALLGARGLDEVLIVTDPYHALRSRETAEEVGLTARVSSTDTSVVTGSESLARHLEEAAGVAVGRVIGFGRLADLAD